MKVITVLRSGLIIDEGERNNFTSRDAGSLRKHYAEHLENVHRIVLLDNGHIVAAYLF